MEEHHFQRSLQNRRISGTSAIHERTREASSQNNPPVIHTAVKRGVRAQFPPKLSLNKVLNFRKFSLSSPKLRQSLKS